MLMVSHVVVLLAQTVVHDERSAPITVLLVGLGAAVGVIVGVIPALIAATLLGYLPPPRLRRRGDGMLVEPARSTPQLEAVPEPVAEPVRAPPPPPSPVALAAVQDAPRSGPLGVLPRARHQAVYDAAYEEQLDRVQTLRSAIGGRRRKPVEPPAE
jgi:hypothetical protein